MCLDKDERYDKDQGGRVFVFEDFCSTELSLKHFESCLNEIILMKPKQIQLTKLEFCFHPFLSKFAQSQEYILH
jgi:hypothetical protein